MTNCSSFKSFTLTIVIAILVWSSFTHQTCIAKRHWRSTSTSFSRKKTAKNHHHNNNGHAKSKPKSPTTHKPPPSPSAPAPKYNVPSTPPGIDNAAIYNVLSFGAKGDGTTDDTKVSK